MSRTEQPVAERVLWAVAAETTTDPLELPPLSGAIDPDALDALAERMAEGEVVFTYADCEVTVTADGSVDVDSFDVSVQGPEKVSAAN
ncbi:hypothetical protein JCM30237_07810 [Halolamina litorea]|uniref:HalOD1 output domain-containing protein n=1 Tax=Halolamina litorea TaxID=1515593 RepID=A0ABD6BTD3_9EURY|nr:HalOD1 output domain-containing protein [Halolamina litorea]